MRSKPERWLLGDEDEKFKIYHYEAAEGQDSGLMVDLRWSIARGLFVSVRSNAFEEETGIRLDPPIKNHAVAKRKCFELIALAAVPLVT
jgi:hypothetical protein